MLVPCKSECCYGIQKEKFLIRTTLIKLKRLLVSLISVSLLFLAPGCAKKSIDTTELSQSDSLENGDLTVIGFSQLGAESDWRSANTQSMKEAFTEENGYRLIFEDGQQKQAFP